MSKFYGKIGFGIPVETVLGVWDEDIEERSYRGELVRINRKLQSSTQVNDDIAITNEISIVSDPYAERNFQMIRYAEFMGVKWKVTNVEVQYPRLILSLGGVYVDRKK